MANEPKTRALTIRFSESDWEAMHDLSDRLDLPIATIVRKALREFVANNKPRKR